MAWYDHGYGWSLRSQARREGQTFVPGDTYERLTRDELLDVLLVVAVELLELEG